MLALPPTAQRLQIRGIRIGVRLKEGNKLGCRELITLDPAQNVIDGRGEKIRDGIDTVRSIERWFSRRIPRGHRFLGLSRNAPVYGHGTANLMVESKVTIDLPESRQLIVASVYVYLRRSPVAYPFRASRPFRCPRWVAPVLRAGPAPRHCGLCPNRAKCVGESTATSPDGTQFRSAAGAGLRCRSGRG